MKAKITITGKRVHDIGYRYYLMENALAFGIERFRAINIAKDKQVVEVFVEGEGYSVKEFCEFVKVNFPSDAIVDEVKLEDYKGYIPKIEAFALVFNVGQSRKFIEEAKKVKEELIDVKNTIKEESEKTRDKIDESTKIICDKIDESTKTICNKIDDLRYDLRAYL